MRMIASTGADTVIFTLPTWTAICSFMVFPMLRDRSTGAWPPVRVASLWRLLKRKRLFACDRESSVFHWPPNGVLAIRRGLRRGGAVSRMAAYPSLRVSRITSNSYERCRSGFAMSRRGCCPRRLVQAYPARRLATSTHS